MPSVGRRVAVIEAERLTKTFELKRRRQRRTVEAVRGISFLVDRGERRPRAPARV
jgi:ABC-type oligopeptide transport system ATPase subunit